MTTYPGRLSAVFAVAFGASPFTILENEVDKVLGTARWAGHVDRARVDVGAMEEALVVPGVPVEPAEPAKR